jgi:transcriptional regulator of acetoin/glycerol metabolism
MPIEVLARPVIDALLRALARAQQAQLQRNARKALSEAITELIRITPNVQKAKARIAIAKAAGIIDSELFVAERMLKKVKKSNRRDKAKTAAGRAGAGKRPAARRVRKARSRRH